MGTHAIRETHADTHLVVRTRIRPEQIRIGLVGLLQARDEGLSAQYVEAAMRTVEVHFDRFANGYLVAQKVDLAAEPGANVVIDFADAEILTVRTRAHLRHIGLADDDCARRAQSTHQRVVVRRYVRAIERRAIRGQNAFGFFEILDADREETGPASAMPSAPTATSQIDRKQPQMGRQVTYSDACVRENSPEKRSYGAHRPACSRRQRCHFALPAFNASSTSGRHPFPAESPVRCS